MRTLFVVASAFGLLLGATLLNAAQATTPCRSDCNATYDYCVYSGQPRNVCLQQREECLLECNDLVAPTQASAAGIGPDAALQQRFLSNAQRRPIPLPRAG